MKLEHPLRLIGHNQRTLTQWVLCRNTGRAAVRMATHRLDTSQGKHETSRCVTPIGTERQGARVGAIDQAVGYGAEAEQIALLVVRIVIAVEGNNMGQLADGSTVSKSSPVVASVPARVKTVSAGNKHTCVLTMSGTVYCAGWNASGQVGNNSNATAWTGFKLVEFND